MFQVTTQRAFQAVSLIAVLSGAALLPYLPYRLEVWLCTALLILVFVFSPLLGKPDVVPEADQQQSIPTPALSTVADRILVTDAEDVEGFALGMFQSEILVSTGAITDLTNAQLDALIAHEDGHLRYNHFELLVLFRSLWVTLGALILTSSYAQWAVEPLLFASVWLLSELLLAKAWLRLAEFHADQVAVSRTSFKCYSSVLEKVTDTTPQNRTLVANLNATHPTYAQRRSQLELSEQPRLRNHGSDSSVAD